MLLLSVSVAVILHEPEAAVAANIRADIKIDVDCALSIETRAEHNACSECAS
jgi:hypothetical protein